MKRRLAPLATAARWLLDESGLGDGDDETRAPFPGVRELLHDFLLEVPGEDQDVVRTGFVQALGGVDWDVRAGQELALFVGVAVDREVQEVFSNATIVEQRVALAG